MSSVSVSAVNLIIASSILSALATISVALRFVSIHRIGRTTKLHDWLTIIALITMYGQAISAMIGTGIAGFGTHLIEVFFTYPTELFAAAKIVFASTLFWLVSTLAFRSAILLLYLELFSTLKSYRYCFYALQTIVVLFFIGGTATTLGLCHPIARNWDRTVPGHCGDGSIAVLAAAIFGTILDALTVVLPLPVVWQLQMAFQKKVAITITFALGLIICGINVARIVVTEVCDASDLTYCIPYNLILALCEMATGIMVACIPTLGPIFFPKRYKSTKNYDWKHSNSRRTGKSAGTSETSVVEHETTVQP